LRLLAASEGQMGGGAAKICAVFPLQAGDNRFVRFKPQWVCLGREMHRRNIITARDCLRKPVLLNFR